MQEDPFNEIVLFLESKGVDYVLYKHKPIITSEEANEVRKSSATVVKSLLFKTEGGYVLLVLPGDKRVSSKKVRSFLGVKEVRMASPEDVLSIMGCEVGGCYPLGFICGVKTVADVSIKEAESLMFSVGRRDRSIEIKREDFEKISSLEVASIS